MKWFCAWKTYHVNRIITLSVIRLSGLLCIIAELYFNFAHYRYRFSMPHSDWPMREDKLWYSFDVANIHFIRSVLIQIDFHCILH